MVDQKVETQSIVQGPMASQIPIKMLGTTAAAYTNANAAHPFENPTPLSNFLQMLAIFSIGTGLTYYLGRMTKNQAHGWAVWATMLVLFLAGVFLCWWAEAKGNPIHQQLGIAAAGGNMEGKESPLRHLQLRAVRHGHHGCVVWRGQFDARFLYRAGRVRAAVQYGTRRSHLRRCRGRTVRNVGVRRASRSSLPV